MITKVGQDVAEQFQSIRVLLQQAVSVSTIGEHGNSLSLGLREPVEDD